MSDNGTYAGRHVRFDGRIWFVLEHREDGELDLFIPSPTRPGVGETTRVGVTHVEVLT